MLSALIYAEEDSKRENERRAAWPRRGSLRETGVKREGRTGGCEGGKTRRTTP